MAFIHKKTSLVLGVLSVLVSGASQAAPNADRARMSCEVGARGNEMPEVAGDRATVDVSLAQDGTEYWLAIAPAPGSSMRKELAGVFPQGMLHVSFASSNQAGRISGPALSSDQKSRAMIGLATGAFSRMVFDDSNRSQGSIGLGMTGKEVTAFTQKDVPSIQRQLDKGQGRVSNVVERRVLPGQSFRVNASIHVGSSVSYAISLEHPFDQPVADLLELELVVPVALGEGLDHLEAPNSLTFYLYCRPAAK
jgi:hypothetical protein